MNKYGWESGIFSRCCLGRPDPLNRIYACAGLLSSPGFPPENHRAQMKGELNCKKCLAASLHSPTTRFLPPPGRQISPACFMYCMVVLRVCVRYSHTCDHRANSWGLKAFFVFRNFKSHFSFVFWKTKSQEQGLFVYPQAATVWYQHKPLLKLSSSYGQNGRNHALFLSGNDIHLFTLIALLHLVHQDRW